MKNGLAMEEHASHLEVPVSERWPRPLMGMAMLGCRTSRFRIAAAFTLAFLLVAAGPPSATAQEAPSQDTSITTDDVTRYRGLDLPRDAAGTVSVRDRSVIVEAQEELAGVSGVTVLIHDQACAAQNRRLRKRDLVTTPAERVIINHRICEACGDCGVVSNCLSVQAVDTPLGVKTTIDARSRAATAETTTWRSAC